MIQIKSGFRVNALASGILLACATTAVQADSFYSTTLRTQFDSELAKAGVKAGLDADGYLKIWLDENSQLAASSEFRLHQVKTSLSATHYHYQQYKQGLPVDKAGLVLSISLVSGTLIKTYSHLVDPDVSISKAGSNFSLKSREALNIAWNNLRARGALKTKPEIEKVWLPTEKGLVATYRVALSLTEPLGDWYQYVDGKSGEVLKLEQRAIFENKNKGEHLTHYKPNHFVESSKLASASIDKALKEFEQRQAFGIGHKQSAELTSGMGQIFDPDPATTLNDESLTDGSADELFESAYSTYILPEVSIEEGVYHLKSPWVELRDIESPNIAPAISTTGEWLFKRGQDGFDDTMVFYHIDANQRYIQSLGFKGENGIQYGPIGADANGVNGSDNSHYSPGANTLAFGHGGVNDSEDADVILHEYGHAIHSNINSSWGGGDSGAMGEGFGDYWAGSYSLTTLNGDVYFPNRVFNWDGHNEFWPGRFLNDFSAQYNAERNYGAHATVDGVLGDQLWSTPLFQSLLVLIKNGYAREEADRIVLESQFGLGSGLTMRMMAQSVVRAASVLYPDGPHAGIYRKHFIAHNILEQEIKTAPLTVSAGSNDSIDPGETVSLNIPLTSTGPSATDVSGKISLPDNFEAVALSSRYDDIPGGGTVINNTPFQFKVPDDIACDTSFSIGFEYQASIEGSSFSDTDEFKLLVGKLEMGSAVQSTSLSIPDNGPEVVSSLSVDRADLLVKNLKVRVDIRHTYIGDLEVALESPSGTRVLLHSRSGGSTDNLQVAFPDDASPVESLSILEGEVLAGEWKLLVQDRAGQDVGELVEWELIFDESVTCE